MNNTSFAVTPILTEATQDQVTAAVESNLFDLFRSMSILPGAELDERGGLSRHHAFPMNPMFKGVWQARLAPAEVDAAIDDCLACFQWRNAPFFFWWIGNATQPRDLGERLAARGFQAWELNALGMVADLAQLDYAAIQRVPAGFLIEPVTDNAGLEAFKHTFITSYGVPEWAAQAWVDATQSAGIERAPWRIYVGWLGDEPVACTILFNGGGVASVYGVGTVPSARKQGLGAAITLRAYRDTFDMGYRYGVLFATEDGLPVYRRIGFADTEARISRYLWRQAA